MNNSSCTGISSLFCKNKLLPAECDCTINSRQSPIDIKRSTLNLGKTEILNVNYKTVSLYKYLVILLSLYSIIQPFSVKSFDNIPSVKVSSKNCFSFLYSISLHST